MNIQLRLSTRVSKGLSEVLVRFYDGPSGFRAKSRVFAPADAWNMPSERFSVPRCTNSHYSTIIAANRKLDTISAAILQQWELDRYDTNPDTWLQSVIDHALSLPTATSSIPMLEDAVRTYASQAAAPNTRKNILVLANNLHTYNRPVRLSSVTTDYVTRYASYLYTLVSPNTAKKMLSSLRTVCNRAVDDELLSHSPFGGSHGYTIGRPIYGSPQYLTLQERDYLTTFAPLPPKLAIQRDIFIFQCHVGCRVSDLRTLTPANIADGWLQYIPHKTIHSVADTVRVPLSPVALSIIDRYRHTRLVTGHTTDTHTVFAEYITDPAYTSPTLLPCVSDQEYNRCIHDIFVLAGMNRPVLILDKHTGEPTTATLADIATSHLARKTFSQLIFSHTLDTRITASFTGHSPSSRAFTRYNEVSDTMKSATLSAINATTPTPATAIPHPAATNATTPAPATAIPHPAATTTTPVLHPADTNTTSPTPVPITNSLP